MKIFEINLWIYGYMLLYVYNYLDELKVIAREVHYAKLLRTFILNFHYVFQNCLTLSQKYEFHRFFKNQIIFIFIYFGVHQPKTRFFFYLIFFLSFYTFLKLSHAWYDEVAFF